MADAARLSDVGGVLLAGGRSSRFGSEKSVAVLNGRPMMDVVAECFAPLAGFAVSARCGSAAARRAAELGLEILPDNPGFAAGPLAGVAAAMSWAQRQSFGYVATAPCDAPLLPRNLFAVLLRGIGGACAAYAVTEQGPHPLCAVWRVDLRSQLEAQLRSGGHPPVHHLLRDIGAADVRFSDDAAFANANTPAALAALEHQA
ncbi:molybdenum cofactor guanylyltransferase [Terricaulis sp.]|uniref:molybdenum cofactor guanylyltransferase n=1 Tax=Terricaulis sp. TaxID=2768686 RepID=UPI003784A80C